MQPEVRDEGGHNVGGRGRRQDKGQVGPAKSGEIAGEEADEADDSRDDPGICERIDQPGEVLEIGLRRPGACHAKAGCRLLRQSG